MHFLIFKAMEAANQGDGDRTVTCFLNQQSFLEDHLGAWVPEFTGNVVDKAMTSFYQIFGPGNESLY